MKKITALTVIVLLISLFPIGSGLFAQDFGQLLDAVERVETNLNEGEQLPRIC